MPKIDITLGPTDVVEVAGRYQVDGATVFELNDRGVNRMDAHVSGYRDGADGAECIRIARLFAAAPDLLEALNFYVSICGNTCYSVDRETARAMYEKAQKAIAKAEPK